MCYCTTLQSKGCTQVVGSQPWIQTGPWIPGAMKSWDSEHFRTELLMCCLCLRGPVSMATNLCTNPTTGRLFISPLRKKVQAMAVDSKSPPAWAPQPWPPWARHFFWTNLQQVTFPETWIMYERSPSCWGKRPLVINLPSSKFTYRPCQIGSWKISFH